MGYPIRPSEIYFMKFKSLTETFVIEELNRFAAIFAFNGPGIS